MEPTYFQCGCENINCPFCNLLMSISNTDASLLHWQLVVSIIMSVWTNLTISYESISFIFCFFFVVFWNRTEICIWALLKPIWHVKHVVHYSQYLSGIKQSNPLLCLVWGRKRLQNWFSVLYFFTILGLIDGNTLVTSKMAEQNWSNLNRYSDFKNIFIFYII